MGWRVPEFTEWLRDNGALIQTPTNAYEVLRYKLHDATHVLYQNKAGRLTVTDAIRVQYRAFEAGVSASRARPSGKRRAAIVDTLLIRDGESCVICGDLLQGDITLEHFLPKAAGGSNDKRNLGLAHQRCNAAVGDMAVIEKMAVRDACHCLREVTPPWEFVDIASAVESATKKGGAS